MLDAVRLGVPAERSLCDGGSRRRRKTQYVFSRSVMGDLVDAEKRRTFSRGKTRGAFLLGQLWSGLYFESSAN